MAWGAVALARVDGTLGSPAGPDRLVTASDPIEAPQVAADNARRALRDRPIDGRAYRLLAQATAAEADFEHTLGLYRIAAERWPRERIAQAVLADAAFAAGEWDTAIEHFDALLRVAPASRAALLAAITPHLEREPLRDALLRRLALDPPWRAALPATLLADAAPAAPAEQLLAALADILPPNEPEIRARTTLLQRLGSAGAARQAWLETLEPDARAIGEQPGNHVFDGGFELGTLGGGYDWQADMPPGAAAGLSDIDPHEGTQALSVAFSGRAVQFAHLRQQLALAPGDYRLESWSDDRVRTARPFAWHVGCVGEGGSLLELPLPQDPGWQHSSAAFQVPEGCNTQQLILRHTGRNLSERRLRGTLRLDAVRVEGPKENAS